MLVTVWDLESVRVLAKACDSVSATVEFTIVIGQWWDLVQGHEAARLGCAIATSGKVSLLLFTVYNLKLKKVCMLLALTSLFGAFISNTPTLQHLFLTWSV